VINLAQRDFHLAPGQLLGIIGWWFIMRQTYNWKFLAKYNELGYFDLKTEETGDVPVRLFLSQKLLDESEDKLYEQIINATKFPGVKLVVITPDTHYGYGVPVGCVLVTDGAVAMGPVGYDIGCFSGDTRVPTIDGKFPTMKELCDAGEFMVWSVDKNQNIVPAKATANLTRRNMPLTKVTLDNRREIFATADHEFMLRDGSYKRVDQLEVGESLMPFGLHNHRKWQHGYNHKVLLIETTARVEDVFCLTVPEFGNFALDAGVFVHNCGMMSASSDIPAEAATPDKRLQFNLEVMQRVEMGAGGKSHKLKGLSQDKFVDLVKGGADLYIKNYGGTFDRSRAERNRIPVDDDWTPLWGGDGRPERGITQIGSLGGGNHFIELQHDEVTGNLFVQVHTGSRGFGHGLATNYFNLAKKENSKITQLDLGYFEPESNHYKDYLNAVAAGGNFAILNRLVIFEQVSEAFQKVFGKPLDLVYEISHNLVQNEWSEEFGMCWVHRKGATRAFPAGHPNLKGSLFEKEGHPVLIPGSNKSYSYILRPLPKVKHAAYSVNHGAGRKLSRNKAKLLNQAAVNADYKKAGIIVNNNDDVPLDESVEAYKDSQEVIDVIVDAGLATIEHKLWPLSSLKGLS
jgi:tRNA-splicing ligase RtcB